MGAVTFHLPDTLAGLRAIMGEALRIGILLRAEGRTDELEDKLDRLLARGADAVPEFLAPDADYWPMMRAALEDALETGIAARRARENAEAGRELDEDAPARFMGATVPPDPIWLAEQAQEIVHRAAASAVLAGVAMPGTDLYSEGAEKAEPAFVSIDEDGTQRIRSHWMRDTDAQSIYQMVLLRRAREITVFRRYLNHTEYTPVIGGFDLQEARFLYRALQEIFLQQQEEEAS